MVDVKVGIVNVTGYIGVELARLLHEHPGVSLVSVTGRSAAGKGLGEVFPHLADTGLTIESDLGKVDFAFVALPHGESATAVVELIERGIKVVDVGADFRLKDVAEYEKWYKVKHPAPGYVGEAVYGLVELNREQVKAARLVASPGCYPTASLLPLVFLSFAALMASLMRSSSSLDFPFVRVSASTAASISPMVTGASTAPMCSIAFPFLPCRCVMPATGWAP